MVWVVLSAMGNVWWNERVIASWVMICGSMLACGALALRAMRVCVLCTYSAFVCEVYLQRDIMWALLMNLYVKYYDLRAGLCVLCVWVLRVLRAVVVYLRVSWWCCVLHQKILVLNHKIMQARSLIRPATRLLTPRPSFCAVPARYYASPSSMCVYFYLLFCWSTLSRNHSSWFTCTKLKKYQDEGF